MHRFRVFLIGVACAATAALAVETKTWVQNEASDFEKGALKGLAVSTDGRVSLAPVLQEIHDPSAPLLWAAVADSRGRFYAGGAGGKVFVVEAGVKGRLLAEIAGGDIYALAVNRRDEVFAANAPDGKVYRFSNGKLEAFYDPKAKYIWAMVFDAAGNLYVGTGDKGEVHRIAANGQGSVFYASEETHARSLALDRDGNLLIGTDPGGLVIRVNAKGEGFVLYQTPRREVTALAVAADGAVYAACTGAKSQAAAPAAPPAQIPITPMPVPGAAAAPAAAQARPAIPPPTFAPAPGAAAGAEIYRIAADGAPRRVWQNAQHLVYALAFDAQKRLVVATGNQGFIYRLDSDLVSTRLADAEPAQVTAMAAAPGGGLYAVTSNPGKLLQLGPAMEKTGSIESEAFDAAAFSRWGRLSLEAEDNGGTVLIETRSGNTDRPQKNWSPWAGLNQGRVVSPPARFLVWRATLSGAPGGASPVLRKVEVAWQGRNLGPLLERIEITPSNYKFPAQTLTLSAAAGNTLSLPALGQPRRPGAPAAALESGGSAVTMNLEKGARGARWRASDPNGDTLEFKVEMCGRDEREWKLLKDSVRDTRYSWDSTAWPDGEYRIRITASDLPDNYPGQALTAQMESDPFVIDNTPPEIRDLAAQVQGEKLVLRFRATDVLSSLQNAEYSVNGSPWTAIEPATRLTDSREHDYAVEAGKPAGSEFTVAVRVLDENENAAVKKVVVR